MSNIKNENLKLYPKSIRNIIAHQLAPYTLKDKIHKLSPSDRKELEKFKKNYYLETDEDVIDFILNGLKKVTKPKDRDLLSKPLMNEIDNIDKISYRNEIQNFKKLCNFYDKDLYTIIMESLHSLWVRKYQKEEAFGRFEIYKDFEKVLFKQPRYRDHFIHQFQVFLSGIPIINKHHDSIVESYTTIFGNDSKINIDFSWLLAATFHDIGYLVQQFDEWLNSFFKEFLEISEIPINLDFGKLFLIRNFQEYMDKLTSLYMSIYCDNNDGVWTYTGKHQVDNEFRKMISSKVISDRNHGLISALILLDRIENSKVVQGLDNYKDGTFTSSIMPSALSISLHDDEIFLNKKIKQIEFSKDPLSFILIYCDTIQEWGRPISYLSSGSIEYAPNLTDFTITENTVSSTLTYNKIKEITMTNDEKITTFDLKKKEIEKVFSKLKSRNIKFEITLQSLDETYNLPGLTRVCLR
jgi:hypothetical protein